MKVYEGRHDSGKVELSEWRKRVESSHAISKSTHYEYHHQPFVMTQSHQPSVSCHNCRQRRLKCDRSLPHCSKCIKRGQTCLGYGRLLRWEQGIASRGKMAGRTFQPPSQLPSQTELLPLNCSLFEPFFQDLTFDSRKYLLYCKQPAVLSLLLQYG